MSDVFLFYFIVDVLDFKYAASCHLDLMSPPELESKDKLQHAKEQATQTMFVSMATAADFLALIYTQLSRWIIF